MRCYTISYIILFDYTTTTAVSTRTNEEVEANRGTNRPEPQPTKRAIISLPTMRHPRQLTNQIAKMHTVQVRSIKVDKFFVPTAAAATEPLNISAVSNHTTHITQQTLHNTHYTKKYLVRAPGHVFAQLLVEISSCYTLRSILVEIQA